MSHFYLATSVVEHAVSETARIERDVLKVLAQDRHPDFDLLYQGHRGTVKSTLMHGATDGKSVSKSTSEGTSKSQDYSFHWLTGTQVAID